MNALSPHRAQPSREPTAPERSALDNAEAWSQARRALTLLAIDPAALGGAVLRAQAGPVRDCWLALFRASLPPRAPWKRLPASIDDGRLLGGLDLGATLQAGRKVASQGVLAEADGGVVVLPMAERLSQAVTARLCATIDTGFAVAERDGMALRQATRFGVVALDEATLDENGSPASLDDRLAFHIDLTEIGWREAGGATQPEPGIEAARALLPQVTVPRPLIEALCVTAASLGIASLRAPMLAVAASRAAAALAGEVEVRQEDAALAARLVLAPRATVIPAPPPQDNPPQDPAPENPPDETPEQDQAPPADPGPVPDKPGSDKPDDEDRETRPEQDEAADILLEAARAAIPAGLLAQIQMGRRPPPSAATQGRQGDALKVGSHGRSVGLRAGDPSRGLRLNLLATLSAASPWQRLRLPDGSVQDGPGRIAIRREDFRVTRFEQRTGTTTIFVVDASGSSALNRLAEAKGAVELLLADCYTRRDQVAVIAFRGRGAQLLLPPTRSLVRAKKSLATLPGGGGTPIAAGIEAGLLLALLVRRNGSTPSLVVLTDGRANVAKDGAGGRPRAQQEATDSARAIRARGIAALLVDTSPRPAKEAERLAAEMGALYVPLPFADAASLSRTIRSVRRPEA